MLMRITPADMGREAMAAMTPVEQALFFTHQAERIDDPAAADALRHAGHRLARHADRLDRRSTLLPQGGRAAPEEGPTALGLLPTSSGGEPSPASEDFSTHERSACWGLQARVRGPSLAAKVRTRWTRIEAATERFEETLIGGVVTACVFAGFSVILIIGVMLL